MKKIILLVLIFLQGCSSGPVKNTSDQTLFFQLAQLFDTENVTDARFQRIKGKDYFQVTLPLRYQIAQYDEIKGLQDKKRFVSEFIVRTSDTGEQATALALTRLAPDKISAFQKEHPGVASGSNSDSQLLDIFEKNSSEALRKEQDRVDAIGSETQLDKYWSSFVEGIEESILSKGRLQRKLKSFYAVPFIKTWIAYHEATDYRGSVDTNFVDGEIYSPLLATTDHQGISQEDWEMLEDFAPVIVHEINKDAPYTIDDDRIGAVSLQGESLEKAIPFNDTHKPTLYAYVDQKNIQGSMVKQLVYTFFHPQHPKLSSFDPEAGDFDGWTVRISLSQNNQPLVYESVSNCGCYYKVFPTDIIEEEAQQAFSEKLNDKQFFVENIVRGKYDAVVPELVKASHTSKPENVYLYYSAGLHQLTTIRPRQQAELLDKGFKEKSYSLRPYDELENLPFNGHHASLFDTDGLVRKADRSECKLLAASGVYHAGHPRQRGTQMIYFDDAAFDDPGLLETYLRLPANAFAASK